MYSRSDRGHPCRTPQDSANGSERKPLLEITESIFLNIFLIKLISISEYPSFFMILYENSLSTLSKAFSWSTDFIFFVELCVMISRIVKRIEKIDLSGMPQVCSLEIVGVKVVLSLFESSLGNIL